MSIQGLEDETGILQYRAYFGQSNSSKSLGAEGIRFDVWMVLSVIPLRKRRSHLSHTETFTCWHVATQRFVSLARFAWADITNPIQNSYIKHIYREPKCFKKELENPIMDLIKHYIYNMFSTNER